MLGGDGRLNQPVWDGTTLSERTSRHSLAGGRASLACSSARRRRWRHTFAIARTPGHGDSPGSHITRARFVERIAVQSRTGIARSLRPGWRAPQRSAGHAARDNIVGRRRREPRVASFISPAIRTKPRRQSTAPFGRPERGVAVCLVDDLFQIAEGKLPDGVTQSPDRTISDHFENLVHRLERVADAALAE